MIQDQSAAERELSLRWHQVWFKALVKPSVETFEDIARDPQITAQRAYTWVYGALLVTQAITLLSGWLTGGVSGGAVAIVCIPVTAGAGLLGFAANVGVAQWVARRLGGTGTYDDLVPLVAAYQAPFTVIWGVLSLVATWMQFGLLQSIPVFGYLTALQMMALKAVNRFSWGRALLAALAPISVVLLVVGAAAIALRLAGLSPSNIIGTGN